MLCTEHYFYCTCNIRVMSCTREHIQGLSSRTCGCSADVIGLLLFVSVIKQVLRVKQVKLHSCAMKVLPMPEQIILQAQRHLSETQPARVLLIIPHISVWLCLVTAAPTASSSITALLILINSITRDTIENLCQLSLVIYK